MPRRDAEDVPQEHIVYVLFVQTATPRPPDTIRTSAYSVAEQLKLFYNKYSISQLLSYIYIILYFIF